MFVGHGEPGLLDRVPFVAYGTLEYARSWIGVWLSFLQDGEPVSKNAEKILEKGQEALDERTGAVEQHKVGSGNTIHVTRVWSR